MQACTKRGSSRVTLHFEEANTPKPKPITKSKEGMYPHCRQWCFSACDGRKVQCLSARKRTTRNTNTYLEIQTAKANVRSTSRSSALACTGSVWKIRLRYCLFDDCALNCGISALANLEKLPSTQTKRKEDHQGAVPKHSFLSSRSLGEGQSINQARHRWGNLLLGNEMEESTLKLLELFSGSLIDDNALLVKNTPPAEKRIDVRPDYANKTSFCCNRCQILNLDDESRNDHWNALVVSRTTVVLVTQ